MIGSGVPPGAAGNGWLASCNANGRARRLGPAQESSPVALMLAGHFTPGFDHHGMDQDNRFFVRRAPAALEQECIFFAEIFTLDKKFVECRMAAGR